MTLEQRTARNDAYQLIKVAHRILDNAGLTAYAEDAERLARTMAFDAETLRKQEIARRERV
jgi:hypothetical protein